MPPKVKITKEDIINTTLQLVREHGEGAINARAVANALGCSTQPVFSNFATMDELKLAMVKTADELCNERIANEIALGKYPPYKASGMAYIRFAKEERELFKLLYMRDRRNESYDQGAEITGEMMGLIGDATGLSGDGAALFHLEMWAYVHGIASMLATGFFDLDEEMISRILTDSYQGLKRRHEEEQ